MGQAFDQYGQLLGEAFGATKREVFDKLIDAHKDAAEIRIRTLESAGVVEMPRYKCHKEVWALKIQAVTNEADGSARIVPMEEGYAPILVDAAYLSKHAPQPGGYYVVYRDGYRSFSPADAFEDGYTRVS